ncbi:MAG: 2-dehydropantoate 2-reductase [Bacteroidota bacterium]
MKIAIIGIGAMGSLFAARLSTVADVVLVGNWPEQLAALQKGLTLIESHGKSVRYKIPATSKGQEVAPVDLVLVLVKSYQTVSAARQAHMLLSGNSAFNMALTLQNGAGNLEKMEAVLGISRVLAGITTQAANMIKPGIVHDTGPGTIYLGGPASQLEKIKKLSELFKKAGFQVQLSDDIQSLIWGKLAVNAGINTLTAILNQLNGYIGENEVTRRLMFRLAHETAAVAAAQHIKMPYPDIEKQLMIVSRATRANTSSMLKDVLRNAPTEIDAICGEIIKKGKQYSIPTPVNNIVFNMIKDIESGKRKPDATTDLSRILQ